MEMKKIAASLMAGAFLMAGSMAYAQSTTSNTTPKKIPGHPRVNQVNRRFNRQHNRIQQGVNNGTINKRQQTKLARQGKAMKVEEHGMRKADNGHLTKKDQRVLNRQQNKRSREIHRMKHK